MVKFNSSSGRPRFPFLPQPITKSGKKGTNSYKTRRVLKESFTSRRGHVNRENESFKRRPSFRKRPPLRRGRVSPRLSVAGDIRKPPYLGSNELPEIASEHQIHESEGIVKMRAAYELGAHVLENAGCSQFSHACHAGRIIFWKANFYSSFHRNKSTNFFNCHGTVRAFAVFTSALCVEPITQEALRVMGSCSLSSLLYEPNQYCTAGSTGGVTWPNNRTADGSPAAQFGHTISIIRTGVGIVTC